MAESEAPKPENSFTIFGRRVTVSSAIFGAILTAMVGIFGNWIVLVTKDHELKVRLVEIGIGILRADPKENLTPAREWAIRIIEKSSGYEFLKEDKQLLLHAPLLYRGGTIIDGYAGDPGFASGSWAPKKSIRHRDGTITDGYNGYDPSIRPTPTEIPK